MSEEMAKVYDPKQMESQAYARWGESHGFDADPGRGGDTYTIVIPPPNVTAPLHLGHALNNTLQDILIRWRRMQGRNTLWMPGTDHAGIATQTVVEKRILADEGRRRTDFPRDEFVGRVQAWKDEYEKKIISQLQAMGCSCDWRRTRFTMDDVCAKAVRATFFKLFSDGLIYRGKRLVNWDPATQTVLADDEVEHEMVAGHFWYLQYPLVEPVEVAGELIEHVTVATTRPETMLGDTAVAMNPNDPRAGALVGRQVRLPIVGRLIPIIVDDHVVLADPESYDDKARFSTGFLKVTPAHDPNDWEIGRRHDLAVINVMAPDGSISHRYDWDDWDEIKNPDVENLIGMDRFEAREAIIEWFRTETLLQEVREYAHEVGHSYRSHVPIEPYLSDQWYVAVKKPIDHLAEQFGAGMIEGTDVPMNSLAGLALKPLLDGKVRFTPDRYAKTYQTWLENLRDWPISRQLWWGHQIPIWSLDLELPMDVSPEPTDRGPDAQACAALDRTIGGHFGEVMAGFPVQYMLRVETHPEKEGWIRAFLCLDGDCPPAVERLETAGFVRDPDVLDTWFSSALWPFSTLGWPDQTPELGAFYPGDVLCTAREIITLWVSRMVMMGQYCVGDIPFSDVFIHAMIQDGQGRKMSKSLGNGIDPLVAIDSHGCDAMRFTLASMTTMSQDVRMPVEPLQLPDGRTVNTSPKFDIGRNFCNKMWNASRFALMNLGDFEPGPVRVDDLALEDKWILSRLAHTTAEVTRMLTEFRFSDPVNLLYRFFWNELCDWYLELIKPRMRDEQRKQTAQRVLAYVLDCTLRLLHPVMPFITEEIYQQLQQLAPQRGLGELAPLPAAQQLIIAPWPTVPEALADAEAERQLALVQTVIRLVRDVRTRYQVAPREPLGVAVKAGQEICTLLSGQSQLLSDLAYLETFSASIDCVKPRDAAVAVSDEFEVYVMGVIDVGAEAARLDKQKEELLGQIKRTEGKLGNENFVNRAKPEVVQRERDRLVQLQEQLAGVAKNLADLG